MKKALFLINSTSGRLEGKQLKKLIFAKLHKLPTHFQYEIEFTDTYLLSQLKHIVCDYETIIAAGGDGTFSYLVQAIADLKYKPKIGLIPIGTGNDLAGSLGVLQYFQTHGLIKTLETFLQGNTIPLDILRIHDRCVFTNYFGIGNDAKISNEFNRLRFKPFYSTLCSSMFNKAFYGVLALKSGAYKIPFDIELRYRTNQSQTEYLVVPQGISGIVVSNVKSYAGGVQLSSHCKMDDGKFEVTVISSTAQWLMMLFSLLLKKPLNILCPRLTQFQTDRLELLFTGDTFYQIDGEANDGFPSGKKHLITTVDSGIEVIVS